MAAIRVMIGDMPPLLRSLVEGILKEDPQFELMRGDPGGEAGSDSRTGFDVLVVSEDVMTQLLPNPAELTGARELGIVAIGTDGSDAAVVRLYAHRCKLDDGPRQSLSQAILASAGVAEEMH